MKKLIKSMDTGAFFKDGNWVEDFRLAQDFPEVEAAFQANARYHLRNVALYYLVGDKPSPERDWALGL